MSASQYAKNLLQEDYAGQGELSESRDWRIESISGSQPKRHKPVSQREIARELEELRSEANESVRENSEERTSQVASSRRGYASAIVVVSVIVKQPSNKPASLKPQLH
jgi:hypothetical protein